MQYYAFDDSCQALVGNFFNHATGELIPARCKKWSCKFCGPRRARRFVARVLKTPSLSYFVTLTSVPHDEYLAREHVKRFNACWRSWLQWLKREVGVSDCSWVLERGNKSGHLHKHALLTTGRSFSYKRARAAIVRCGLGAVCDFQRISGNRRAANYLAKYLQKADGAEWPWPRYTRRAQTSQPDFPREPSTFTFIQRPLKQWRRRPERDIPLIHEFWLAWEMPGWQLPIALNHEEKVRHENQSLEGYSGP